MRAVLRLAAAVVLFVSAVVWPQAARADDGERITAFAATYTLRANGSVEVTEHLTYRFSGSSSHGIRREIITAQDYRQGSDLVRVYRLHDVSASSPSGAPADVEVKDGGDASVVQIGDADRTVSGTQRYDVRYTPEHVVNRQSARRELPHLRLLRDGAAAASDLRVRPLG